VRTVATITAGIILAGLVLASCTIGDPYGVAMHETRTGRVRGRIVGNPHRVHHEALNAVRIYSGAAFGFRVEQHTDGVFDAEVELDSAADVTLLLRTTLHAYSQGSKRHVALRLTPTLATLTLDDGRTVHTAVTLPAGIPTSIRVVNDGSLIDITVGCTHLGRFATGLPATEWIVVAPLNAGSIRVVDPHFSSLYERY